MPEIDDRDRAIVAERMERFRALSTSRPTVGEFLRFPDGSFLRVTYCWDDTAQTTTRRYGGSFYLGNSGRCSYSGGLESGIPYERFRLTNETRDGMVWIFHHDQHQAHNGVDLMVPFRVFDVV